MENVDIVNANNRVIGKASKEDAHKKGLLHRTVIAEVRDSKGNWIFVKQAPHKQDRGRYVSPMGGHVKSGEKIINAVKREVLEELGISTFKHIFKGKFIFNRNVNGHVENHYFIVYEIYSDAEPVLNEESVGFVRWSTEKLKTKLKINPEIFGDALRKVLENIYPEIFD